MAETDNKSDESTYTPLDAPTQVAVEAIGKVIHSASIYGLAHRATEKSIAQAYEEVAGIMGTSKRINFSLNSGKLLVNGKLPNQNNAFTRQLRQKMTAREITAFSIVKGMGRDELQQLIELLCSAAGENFEEKIKKGGLEHVKSEKVRLKEVRDGEENEGGDSDRSSAASRGSGRDGIEALAKDWLAGKGAGDGEGDVSTGSQGNATETQRSPGVEQIVAFLKGDVSPDNPVLQENLDHVADDTDKLGNLIMEAATIRQSQTDVQSGESVSDLVIGCLRRTYDGLKNASQSKTKEEKLDLKRSFMLLEKNIMDKLHRITNGSDPAVDARISEAIEEMGDDFELDYIASEYMEQRSALQRNEKKIMEYIRKQDGEGLEKRLLNAGMAPESWHRLTSKSQAEGSGGGESGGDEGVPGSFGALAVVLSKFDELMSSTTPNAKEISQFMDEIEGHVNDVEEQTNRQIEEAAEEFKQDTEYNKTHGKNAGERNREQLNLFIERLSELAQELLQPLTVVNCSVNMAVSGYTGDLSDEQKDILSLALSNGKRLDRLMNKLIDLVGYPKGLKPESADNGEEATT